MQNAAAIVDLPEGADPARPLPDVPPPLAAPTLRQRTALRLLSEGLTHAEVGAEMYLGEDSVKSLLRPLRGLWGGRNTLHLVAIAIRNGFI